METDDKKSNPLIEQTLNIYRNMPLSRKIIIGSVILLIIIGFSVIIFFSKEMVYLPLFTRLSADDAGEIINKLKEQKAPYRISDNGATILVPKEMVYDLRLSIAQAGLPKGGIVGFEIFDKTDFGTTEFVQKLNYQRALQGELSRTIGQFPEVAEARVMIVLPKDSVFIEEEKQPSASVLLKLNSPLSLSKVKAIVHLVSSSVQDLAPDRVTVVDNNERLWPEEAPQNSAQGLASSQLAYKLNYEQNLSKRIQSMLEGIVGKGKAIVRVSAEMLFDQVDFNEEVYDPDSQTIRSKQTNAEKADKKSEQTANVSSVNSAPAAGTTSGPKTLNETNQKQNETINYEISKTTRKTVKSTGDVKRLFVAVALDGKYTPEKDQKGNEVQKYLERNQTELDQFKKIIQNAMGYSTDREDQITVESFPFSNMAGIIVAKAKPDWITVVKENKGSIANILLIIMIFLFIVRPVAKTIKEMRKPVTETALPSPEELQLLAESEEKEQLPSPRKMTPREKAITIAKTDVDKSINMIRGWINS